LPVTAPRFRLRRDGRCAYYHCELVAIGDAANVFTPRHLSSVCGEVLACDVVMNTNLGAANTAEEALSLVRAGAVLRIGLLVIDPLYREVSSELVPVRSLVSVDSRTSGNVCFGGRNAFCFGCAYVRQGATATLTHDNNNLALTGLVDLLAAILAIFALVRRLHIAAKVSAIDLNVSAKRASVTGKPYRLTAFVQHHKGGLVIDVQITGQLEGGVPFRAIGEDGSPSPGLTCGEPLSGKAFWRLAKGESAETYHIR